VAATARSSRKARHLIRHRLTMPPVHRHRHRLLAHSQRLRLTLPHMVSTHCRSSKTSLCSSKTYVLATLNCISNAYRARVAESLGAPSLTTCHAAVQVVLEVRELTAIAFRTGGTFYFAPVDDEESAKENARMAVDVVMAAMNAVPRSTGRPLLVFSLTAVCHLDLRTHSLPISLVGTPTFTGMQAAERVAAAVATVHGGVSCVLPPPRSAVDL
jgi:hypothetical protein